MSSPDNPRPEADGGVMTRYYGDISKHGVMTPEQERRAAERIEETELEHWCGLLAYPPAARHVLEQLSEEPDAGVDPETIREMQGLVEARAANKSKLRPAQARRWQELSAHLARTVRESDPDRSMLEAATQWAREAPVACTPTRAEQLRRIDRSYREQYRAKERFVQANLRLVVTIARRQGGGQMALPDMIQEGNIGLIKAVERFDHRKGFRFSTYASWWIRHAISRAVSDKGRSVRIPVHVLDAHARAHKAIQRFLVKHGREPTIDELAEAVEIPADRLERIVELHVESPVSLDGSVEDEEGRPLGELLVEEGAATPDDDLQADRWAEEVRRQLGKLTPIEARVLRWRFGLDGDEELTLKEIGDKYGLSRERIRQLQDRAIGKIRKHMREF